MARQANWEKHGYETAKGTRGTGWMKFSDTDIKLLLEENPIEEYPDGIPIQSIDDSASAWLETEQFQYEAGRSMRKWANRESTKEGDDTPEGSMYNYLEKESEWIMGFINCMTEMLAKNNIKIDNGGN